MCLWNGFGCLNIIPLLICVLLRLFRFALHISSNKYLGIFNVSFSTFELLKFLEYLDLKHSIIINID